MMKRVILFIVVLSSIAQSVWARSPRHTDEDYIRDPKLALADAVWYHKNAQFDEAIICYKKYAGLTGRDMSAEIEQVRNDTYPIWFNNETMIALPMSDECVLIVWKHLKQEKMWDFPDEITIGDTTGIWETKVDDEMFQVMVNSGHLYIPADGLPSKFVKVSTNVGLTYTKNYKKYHLPNENTTLTVTMKTIHGDKEISGGSLEKHSELLSNGVKHTMTDSRKMSPLKFYPTKIIRKVEGKWQIERLSDRSINSSSAKHPSNNTKV